MTGPETPAPLAASAPATPRTAIDPPGEDLTRIISLSDGVFAFALTLLVLSLVVPSLDTTGRSSAQISRALAGALGADWNRFLGYAFAFFMIAIWWTAHHRIFRYVKRYDNLLVWLNMAVLLEVAVMPFILSVYGTYSETQTAVILFAATQGLTGITLAGLWSYASGDHRLIDRQLDPRVIGYIARRNWLGPLVFAGSIAVAFVNVTAAEISWTLLFVVQRVSGRYGS
jgi:uncharacterized membrane protein